SLHPAMRSKMRKPYSSCAVIFIFLLLMGVKESPAPVELLPTSCFYPRPASMLQQHAHRLSHLSAALFDPLPREATAQQGRPEKSASLQSEHYSQAGLKFHRSIPTRIY